MTNALKEGLSRCGWKDLAQRLETGKCKDKLSGLCLPLVQACAENPEARIWLRQFIETPRGESLPFPCLSYLFAAFLKNPTREEIKTATKFWNKDHQEYVDETTRIIINGKESLTPEECQHYVQEAKRLFDDIDQTASAYNDQSELVRLVGEFEGQGALFWLCQIISTKTLSPTAEEAYFYASQIDRQKTVDSLMINLRNIREDNYDGKYWLVRILIGEELIDLVKTQDRHLIAEAVTELTNLISLEGDECKHPYVRGGILALLKERKAQLDLCYNRSLPLPDNRP